MLHLKPMKQDDKAFEIRVGRGILGTFLGVGILFLLLGVDGLLLHGFIQKGAVTSSFWMLVGFVVFFILIPLLIVVMMGRQIMNPPVMLRIDHQNISFGTGPNYKLKSFPTEYIEHVGIGLSDPSLTDIRPEGWFIHAGVTVRFKKADDVPTMLVTPAGMTYSFRRLKLRALYMNMRPKRAIEGIQRYLKA